MDNCPSNACLGREETDAHPATIWQKTRPSVNLLLSSASRAREETNWAYPQARKPCHTCDGFISSSILVERGEIDA
jgi:hypothetical protein